MVEPNLKAVNNYRTSDKVRAKHPNAKLTESDVIQIRKLAAQGVSRKDLQERFGVTKSTIGDILRGKTWKIPEAV